MSLLIMTSLASVLKQCSNQLLYQSILASIHLVTAQFIGIFPIKNQGTNTDFLMIKQLKMKLTLKSLLREQYEN